MNAKSALAPCPACPACGATPRRLLSDVRDVQSAPGEGVRFDVWECPQCGLGQTWPQPEDLAPHYGAEYHGQRHGFTDAWCMRRRAGWVVRDDPDAVLPRGVLDVGCGDGGFLLELGRRGLRGAGVEYRPEPARAQGLTVFETLGEAVAGGPFGAVTFWHSLEHLREPAAALLEAAALLAPGGTLWVAVPDAGGWQARAFGRHWLHLDVPRHLSHFTAPALRALLERAGLSPREVAHQEVEYDALGWIQSALNTVLPEPNGLFRALTGRPVSGGAPGRWAQWVGGGAMGPAAMLLTWTGAAAGRGGTLVMAGRRR